ncbi:MAG: FMN-dependent NADH-azoreductase [Alphaproteobacteria bacterium]|nr:FMN-dependent NADH-azoreductase [Alphaproteobacteria bacterium]MBT4018321.1 FMN-dependent NADH-azoreductase [Alphaproteobacteria bacterium]MBT5158877.1 FMN-dependent NADH-azoreductase [Alphaproteobacteria bacterium]MBT7746190.1 FMN-dependent NADH-azoreductase [Alphaproteobacteria bacterium]
MNLLAINSSISGDNLVSNKLVEHFVEGFETRFGKEGSVRRDVANNPPPHIDQTYVGATFTPVEQLSDEQVTILKLSDQLISEAKNADIIVIGAAMYNFSISSNLKAWVDHILRAGHTFSYTENGPQGHLTGKKVYVLTARGGDYSEGGFMHAMDHQEPYLRTALGMVGLTDVTFVHAQGLAMGDEVRGQAINGALATIDTEIAALPVRTDSVAA